MECISVRQEDATGRQAGIQGRDRYMSRVSIFCGFAVFTLSHLGQIPAQTTGESSPIQAPGYANPGSATPYYHGNGGQTGHYPQAANHCNCSACTQQPSECWTIFYRNTRWPAPFKQADINAVTSYFAIQRENGWKLHNTLGHVLFDPQTNNLTEAGKNHIRSILKDNPEDRRVVFVLQGQTPQQTSARIESVQLAISGLVPTGSLPAIYITDRDAPGSSGAYQTAITRAMMTSLPAPRLPSFNAGQGNP